MARYNFPKILEVTIRNFSLYSKNRKIVNIHETINAGIFCLAGANGLGKSTFLNIISYGLTGLVLEPGKSFYSPDDICSENGAFTDKYFDGRIKAKDKKNAEIELLFTVNNKFYRIVRNFFERSALKTLEIYTYENEKNVYSISDDNNPKLLNEQYQRFLIDDIGINNFNYFIFLHLYVFTFDENRRLLFWDDKAITNTLSIAFNNDPKDAEELINVTYKMEQYESHARNNRWQATQIKNRINDISKSSSKPDDTKKEDYLTLCRKYDKLQKNYYDACIEYDELLKNRNFLYAEITNLRTKLKAYTAEYSEPISKLLNNQYLQISINNEECILCGAKGKIIAENISKNIYKDNCPLCNTVISNENSEVKNGIFNEMKKTDNEIFIKDGKLNDLMQEIQFKESQKKQIEIEFKSIETKKMKLEREFPQLNNINNTPLNLLEMQYNSFDKKSKDYYGKRDKLKPKLLKLQKRIKRAYSEAELEFVPIFRRLAKNFIGYDLDIRFEDKGKNLRLVLDLDSSARTDSSKLSESQRFFLDIALRMALAEHISCESNKATLFVDTPEGSLDIAYEKRVGIMFADFAKNYQQNIIMTANINSSQLLVALAEKCKAGLMYVKRMLDWVDLSIVQQEEEMLFRKFLDNIESKLRRKK